MSKIYNGSVSDNILHARFAELEQQLEQTRLKNAIVYGTSHPEIYKTKEDELREQLAAKQAEVDALMLEYCPSEMSQEQLDNWAAHQRPAKET